MEDSCSSAYCKENISDTFHLNLALEAMQFVFHKYAVCEEVICTFSIMHK